MAPLIRPSDNLVIVTRLPSHLASALRDVGGSHARACDMTSSA
jgi:hypothetical protein